MTGVRDVDGQERAVAVVTRDAFIASAAQLACLLEASASKPGNVSPGRHFADATFEDFLASAAAIGPAFSGAGRRPLGATIRLAVEAALSWTRSNTNLGIVLLLAPLAKAACRTASEESWTGAVESGALRTALRRVLDSTTIDDSREVYSAIRQSMPGGLGRVETQDVAADPTVSLLDAMRLASDRDGIAHEYSTAYEITFEHAVPWLIRARGDGLSWDEAVVEVFLRLLAARPDTLIARKTGRSTAEDVSRRAASALEAGGVRTAAGRRTIEAMDRALRDSANSANPGTTADLSAAAIYVVLLGGGWRGSA